MFNVLGTHRGSLMFQSSITTNEPLSDRWPWVFPLMMATGNTEAGSRGPLYVSSQQVNLPSLNTPYPPPSRPRLSASLRGKWNRIESRCGSAAPTP